VEEEEDYDDEEEDEEAIPATTTPRPGKSVNDDNDDDGRGLLPRVLNDKNPQFSFFLERKPASQPANAFLRHSGISAARSLALSFLLLKRGKNGGQTAGTSESANTNNIFDPPLLFLDTGQAEPVPTLISTYLHRLVRR
jgi:hypothetical protein